MCSTDLSQALELQEHQSLESSFHVHVMTKEKLIKENMMQHNVREQTDFMTASKKKKEFY